MLTSVIPKYVHLINKVMRENTTLALTVELIKSPDLKSEACTLQTVEINA